MINKKGFTLIELLVVIAIIGLLSTLAIVSLNSARDKARDAKRISDVKQMSGILEGESVSNENTPLAGCTLVQNLNLTSTCIGTGVAPNIVIVPVGQFSTNTSLRDPSTSGSPCNSASTGTCGYSIATALGAAGAKVGDYRICFWLEAGVGTLTSGLNNVKNGGLFSSGCP